MRGENFSVEVYTDNSLYYSGDKEKSISAVISSALSKNNHYDIKRLLITPNKPSQDAELVQVGGRLVIVPPAKKI